MTDIIRIGHTPDLDDAFMFYGLATGKVSLDGFRIEHVIVDIQTLNQQARDAELDVTAISAASYPLVATHYWLLSIGSSVGQGYGPLVVSRHPYSVDELTGKRIAVPGLQTTAATILRLVAPRCVPVEMSFDRIADAVLANEVACGLLIHERQLTYHDQGLLPILDLGMWWHQQTKLPLPLGLNVVKRTLGRSLAIRVAQALRDSILYAMTHQEEALTASMQFGRGIDPTRARQFISMYVNEDTLSLSRATRRGLRLLYQRAYDAGLLQRIPRLTIIEPPKL